MRFGRIPKREKQRMLLEMQNAMNNMMNNSHGNQPLSVSNQTPPLSADGVSADSSSGPSTSPQSNRSESSPESLVSMDTSQSSDSSSATDSGEEEVIGTVTRAHHETFMYNQEQVNVPSEAPDNHAHFTEERQQVWNRQIDASSMTNQNALSSCVAQVPEISIQQYSTVCPVRPVNSSPALHNVPLRYHEDTHATHVTYSVPTCARATRMHLVSYTTQWRRCLALQKFLTVFNVS